MWILIWFNMSKEALVPSSYEIVPNLEEAIQWLDKYKKPDMEVRVFEISREYRFIDNAPKFKLEEITK